MGGSRKKESRLMRTEAALFWGCAVWFLLRTSALADW